MAWASALDYSGSNVQPASQPRVDAKGNTTDAGHVYNFSPGIEPSVSPAAPLKSIGRVTLT